MPSQKTWSVSIIPKSRTKLRKTLLALRISSRLFILGWPTCSGADVSSVISRSVRTRQRFPACRRFWVGFFQFDPVDSCARIKVADLSPKNIFGNKATDGTYESKYWFPGFGFDSGPNLQPWESILFGTPKILSLKHLKPLQQVHPWK